MSHAIPKTISGLEAQKMGDILPKKFTGDRKEALDKIGPLLHQMFSCILKEEHMMRILWKRYLADCRRSGVKPFDPEVGGGERG